MRWVRWMFQRSDLVLRQKHLDRQGDVCWRVVLVKNPLAILPQFRSSFSSSRPFTKVCRNLVVDLVNGLTFRHPIHVNNPPDVWKTISVALNLDLLCHAFFCHVELGLFQCTDWRLLSGSYWKNMIHHKLLSSVENLGCFLCFDECQHKCSFEFPFVQEWGFSAPSSNSLFSSWIFCTKSFEQFPCQC